jgi:hypothetical protein
LLQANAELRRDVWCNMPRTLSQGRQRDIILKMAVAVLK